MTVGRIEQCFRDLSAQQRRCLIAYTLAGDLPEGQGLDDQVTRCLQWVDSGVDILEIGVPFSDPMADGPIIQRAHERSLRRGTRLADVWRLVRAVRERGCTAPVVLMSYLNPILGYGVSNTIEALHSSGVDGLLLVDCPPTEQSDLFDCLLAAAIDPILLVAPDTDDRRLAQLLPYARGFIYTLALKGITGSVLQDMTQSDEVVARLNRLTQLPLAVGFGIRQPEQLTALSDCIRGVVVGSALVELTAQSSGIDCQPALELIAAFKAKL